MPETTYTYNISEIPSKKVSEAKLHKEIKADGTIGSLLIGVGLSDPTTLYCIFSDSIDKTNDLDPIINAHDGNPDMSDDNTVVIIDGTKYRAVSFSNGSVTWEAV